MKASIAGRVRNTTLPRTKPLLPLFEAIMNAFQAIEEAGGDGDHQIDVEVVRHRLLDQSSLGPIAGFTVTDTGIGFTDANFESFNTVDTRYKAAKGAKGLGRFLWLKAFDRVEVESHYRESSAGPMLLRRFEFQAIDQDQPCIPRPSAAEHRHTTVRLMGYMTPYCDAAPQTSVILAQKLIEHFLAVFLDPKCARVRLVDAESIDLNRFFTEHYKKEASEHRFTVGGHEFRLAGFRLQHTTEIPHTLAYGAHFRVVDDERLDRYIPNLSHKLVDEELGSFSYLAFVQGAYLDDRVNNERTAFSFGAEESSAADDGTESNSTDLLAKDVTRADIRTAALLAVRRDLHSFIEELNASKRESIARYVAEDAPQYRSLGRYVDEFIDQIPANPSPHALEMALHEQLYNKIRALKKEGQAIVGAAAAIDDPEEYGDHLRSFVERFNEIGKSSLAEYVAHRRVILDLLEKSLRRDPASGKYSLEEAVHNLVFPMQTTSDEVPFEQQNLWIIDERLTFHSYLASDKSMATMHPLASTSGLRPDLLVFDRALTFSDREAPLTSIVVVEFKRPARERYDDEDPIAQVFRQIREIKEGHFKDRNGREIKVMNSQVPAYAYVVCDITREIEIAANDKALLKTPDGIGYFGFNPNLNTYIEVISYDKLVGDARKRNHVLFEKLGLPPSTRL